MSDFILEEILATDSRIRYVGILSRDLTTVESQARQGVNLLLGKEGADELVRQAAPIILGVLSRFTNELGKLICSHVRFGKISLIFFKIGDKHIVISTEPEPPYDIMRKIEEKFQHS